MTDFSDLLQPDRGQPAIVLHLVDRKGLDAWLAERSGPVRAAARAQGFEGKAGQVAILPGEKDDWSAAIGLADAGTPGTWCLARAAETLPEASYRIAGASPGAAALGWLLAQYRFARYRTEEKGPAKGPRVLLTDEVARREELVLLAEAQALVRDLVNTPASDMGPADIEAAAERVAKAASISVSSVAGAALEEGYPMVAAVGRAAAGPGRAPRLVEFEWGDPAHPRVAIVGKGVCFDSGGLDIKPASGMRLMKKDMGGAAHALALALAVIRARLPVRLHVLLPAVENAIGGNAFRPGDVLRSRKGLTVEIGNTDAEGRLILADALTRACEEKPELILDFATLTGAARVALGPDLPALFANDEALAAGLLTAGDLADDPLWRMPLHKPYEEMLASDIADLGNVSDAPMAGAVTAALFLARFVESGIAWAHFDTFAWRGSARPGRPKGGEALGLRAAFHYLKGRYGRPS
jgi:leucyl aminopeptidase